MQTKRDSVIEAVTSTAAGFVGSWLITMAVLHTVQDRVAAGTLTVCLCTIWSLVRGYTVRRYFNRRTP